MQEFATVTASALEYQVLDTSVQLGATNHLVAPAQQIKKPLQSFAGKQKQHSRAPQKDSFNLNLPEQQLAPPPKYLHPRVIAPGGFPQGKQYGVFFGPI
jgi:hypothetical protein